MPFSCIDATSRARSVLQQLFKPYTVTAVQETVQIHEYLALKFDYETALGTRDFWAEAMWHTCR